jgi:hypothetical protein
VNATNLTISSERHQGCERSVRTGIVRLTLVFALLGPCAEMVAQADESATGSVVAGGTLAIPRHVIATGGGRSAGGAWEIRGTVGQADAEPLQPSTDGSGFYAITGGFWPALPAPQTDWLFADEFEAQAD